MKVIKEKYEIYYDIFLEGNDNSIMFTFGGNGDLYWNISSKRKDASDEYTFDSFVITKENYGVYSLFEELFNGIKNIDVFDDEEIPFYVEAEEVSEYLKRREEEIAEEKERYRLANYANYNELYDDDSKTITWYSDETAYEVANFLKIKKELDTFKIEFYTQPYINGYEHDFNTSSSISIRFRNSGSSYAPFNSLFMKMYNKMQDLDDIYDARHQIHIEEYLYQQEQSRKLVK